MWHTVQDDLLARVNFGKFVCKKQLADFILAVLATLSFFSSFFVLSYGFVAMSTIVINIGDWWISWKIANCQFNSSPINCLVQYMQTNFDGYGLSSLGDIAVYNGWWLEYCMRLGRITKTSKTLSYNVQYVYT